MNNDITSKLKKMGIFTGEDTAREGRYRVMRYIKDDTKFGHADDYGNITTPIIYDYVEPFFDGMAVVKKNGKFGYVNLNGKLVIPLVYDSARSFSSNRAGVIINDKAGHIDNIGNITTPFIYDDTSHFYKSRAKVFLDNKIGYVNLDGELVIPAIFDDGENFSNTNIISVRIKKNKLNINKDGYPSSLKERNILFNAIFKSKI